MKKYFLFFGLATACIATAWVYAEVADRDMPTHIEADQMQHDDIKKITTATGRVIVTKGSIIMRADTVKLQQDKDGKNFVTASANSGNLVFMRQKREGLNEFIEARASKIERDEKTLTSRLIGNASMKRLVGDTVVDSIYGDTLVYNEVTETYQAQANKTNKKPSLSGVPAGRVRATIGARTTITTTATTSPNTPKNNKKNRIQLKPSNSIKGSQ